MSNVSYRVASSLRISGIAKCALDQHVAVLHCWLRGRCPRWAHRLNTVLIQGCATAWGRSEERRVGKECRCRGAREQGREKRRKSESGAGQDESRVEEKR